MEQNSHIGAEETDLLNLCDAYCQRAGITETTLGNKAMGNSRFFTKLRRGGTCTIRKAREAKQWLVNNMPEERQQ